jgi:hypothetical protein
MDAKVGAKHFFDGATVEKMLRPCHTKNSK